jgi:hypothetical protein
LLVLVLLAAGCSRVDTLRLAHANEGTPVEWPVGSLSVELELQVPADGRVWLPVSVDGNAPIPFLLQASAGAIAITGARAAGFGPAGAGRLTLHGPVLPGIRGGLLIKQRRLALDTLVLGDQSLLLVDPAEWPHGQPGRGAAGVLGYDLFRRFVVELDVSGSRLSLYRAGMLDIGAMPDAQRLAILGRLPYFEAWLEPRRGPARWVRLQFEPGAAVGVCLDQASRGGTVLIAGQRIELADSPCPEEESLPGRAERDGIFGTAALQGLVVSVDYEGRRIGFRPRD